MSGQTNLLTVVNTFLVKHLARSKGVNGDHLVLFCVKDCFVSILECVKRTMMIATPIKVMMTTMVIMMKMMMMKMVDEEVIQ